jgi:hypothetical protein
MMQPYNAKIFSHSLNHWFISIQLLVSSSGLPAKIHVAIQFHISLVIYIAAFIRVAISTSVYNIGKQFQKVFMSFIL